MSQAIVQEFAISLPADSSLLRASVITGEPIDQAEILSLMAIAEALYISVTMESRTLGSVDACHQLWSQAARLFNELCDSWTGIEVREPSITWLRGRLAHYRSLCDDRRGLYSITESDRREHAKCKESEMRSADAAEEPQPFSPREISRLDAALSRRLSAGKSF